ncbi:MAG TPA: hypothetical protein VM580_29885 [Labilithrix sp.]|nr:hypothetical protein [Labilithrix sp.]
MTVPKGLLVDGHQYYVRVMAARDGFAVGKRTVANETILRTRTFSPSFVVGAALPRPRR